MHAIGLLAVLMAAIACAHALAGVKRTVTIVQQLEHDRNAFTQGLFFHSDGSLYESTGIYGRSTLRHVETATGQVIDYVKQSDSVFSEGLSPLPDRPDRLVQLTWRAGVAYVYDRVSLDLLDTVPMESDEGWGVTHNGTHVIMSNGSAELLFLDPDSLRIVGRVTVRDDNLDPVLRLNELEYIDGLVWANVWQQTDIVRVDPQTGRVVDIVDAAPLDALARERYALADVVNGIAWPGSGNRILLGGKLWPMFFLVTLDDIPAGDGEDGNDDYAVPVASPPPFQQFIVWRVQTFDRAASLAVVAATADPASSGSVIECAPSADGQQMAVVRTLLADGVSETVATLDEAANVLASVVRVSDEDDGVIVLAAAAESSETRMYALDGPSLAVAATGVLAQVRVTAASTNGSHVVAFDEISTALVWIEPATMRIVASRPIVHELTGQHLGGVSELEFDHAGRLWASLDDYASAYLVHIDLASGGVVGRVDLGDVVANRAMEGPVSAIVWDNVQGRLLVSGSRWNALVHVRAEPCDSDNMSCPSIGLALDDGPADGAARLVPSLVSVAGSMAALAAVLSV